MLALLHDTADGRSSVARYPQHREKTSRQRADDDQDFQRRADHVVGNNVNASVWNLR